MPDNWCEEHECWAVPDADEDGRCDYCPECEAEKHSSSEDEDDEEVAP